MFDTNTKEGLFKYVLRELSCVDDKAHDYRPKKVRELVMAHDKESVYCALAHVNRSKGIGARVRVEKFISHTEGADEGLLLAHIEKIIEPMVLSDGGDSLATQTHSDGNASANEGGKNDVV